MALPRRHRIRNSSPEWRSEAEHANSLLFFIFPILMTSLLRSRHRFVSLQMTVSCRLSPDEMSSRSREAAERPICVTGLGRSMGDVIQPLEKLGPEGVRAEIKMFHQHHTLVFALARLWHGRPTLTKLRLKLAYRVHYWATWVLHGCSWTTSILFRNIPE